ncbi:type III secretion system effector protein [Xanthomonas citri]|uniref:type III secretion system effector XopN n=1 Tax=Xanthomonas citri TaxID=346 RepID=UPI001885428B|nr:type III secretion system effector XopN [Xanthomonas citri]QOY22428.1 type III secretion system effector protein [Xanthomonas citri]QQK68571.1 type III secretion system effector protein [Xanthomonas citri]
MKSSASVDPASRSARTHSQEIQETELAIPSTSAAVIHQSSPDPALSPLGRAPVRRSSGTTLGALLASPEQDAQALAPQPATSSNAATATLARLHRQLASDNARTIAPELAADLITRLRPMKSPGTTGAQARAATHADLVSRISEHDVIDWYKAQGLNETDVATLRRTALLSGLPNPSGSFLTNAMQYIVSPWINYATRQPWAGAGFGLATMLVAAPVNAGQQSAVVSLCESIREHGAHVIVPDKKQINDKHWLPDLADALKEKIETFAKACDVFREIQSAPNSSIEQRAAAADVLLAAEKDLHQAQHDFVMTQGAHDRQWQGNRWQAIPRILRSPVASTLGLLSKTDAMRALSPMAQTVGAMLMTAAQHVAAGFDEQAKQEANNKLNLLYADVLTDAGKQKLASGAAVSGEDIKTDKLRSLIQSPTQALVKRVTAGVAELEKLLADAATAEDAQPGAMTSDDRDIEAGDASKAMQELRLLRNDLEALREGRLDEIDPNGTASKLLIGAEKPVLSQQLFNDIAKKYNYLEFTAQTAQRIGQMFHLVFLGSAASSVISKLVSASQGGTRNVPVGESLAVSAISGGMAAVGALNQHTAITIKNNRREGSTDIGLREQVSRGIMGAMHETLSQRRATKASKAINALLDGNDVEALLAAARALSAQEASTSSSQPQGSPSTSRAAPPRREHVSAPSSPNRSRLGQTSNEITRSKSARDLGMELHQFARIAGKHAKDLM